MAMNTVFNLSGDASRIFAIDVAGSPNQAMVRTSAYTVKVSYSSLSKTLHSIGKRGDKVLNVRLLSSPMDGLEDIPVASGFLIPLEDIPVASELLTPVAEMEEASGFLTPVADMEEASGLLTPVDEMEEASGFLTPVDEMETLPSPKPPTKNLQPPKPGSRRKQQKSKKR